MKNRYYLVQRLKDPWTQAADRGFDGYFALDYMGSAEFEWGAVPESLAAIRKAGKLRLASADVTVNGETVTVYFVGPKRWLADEVVAFQSWVDEGLPGKESSYFDRLAVGAGQDYQRDVVAWWSLTNHVAWSLDREVADRLVEAFGSKKPAPARS